MSPKLRRYLELETKVEECLRVGNEPLVEPIRDIMDHVWSLLSEKEHEFLNSRTENNSKIAKE